MHLADARPHRAKASCREAYATVRSLEGGADDAMAPTGLAEAGVRCAHADASQREGRTHASKESRLVALGGTMRSVGCTHRAKGHTPSADACIHEREPCTLCAKGTRFASKRARTRATRVPVSLRGVPISLTRVSFSLTRVPVSLTRASFSLTRVSVSLTRASFSLTRVSVSLTRASCPLTRAYRE